MNTTELVIDYLRDLGYNAIATNVGITVNNGKHSTGDIRIQDDTIALVCSDDINLHDPDSLPKLVKWVDICLQHTKCRYCELNQRV